MHALGFSFRKFFLRLPVIQLLALAYICAVGSGYLIAEIFIEPSRWERYAKQDFADIIADRPFFKLFHDGLSIPLMLNPGMNEDAKDIGADKRSGPDHFAISFQNQSLPVLMPLKDLRLSMEIFKKLNGPDRIDRNI